MPATGSIREEIASFSMIVHIVAMLNVSACVVAQERARETAVDLERSKVKAISAFYAALRRLGVDPPSVEASDVTLGSTAGESWQPIWIPTWNIRVGRLLEGEPWAMVDRDSGSIVCLRPRPLGWAIRREKPLFQEDEVIAFAQRAVKAVRGSFPSGVRLSRCCYYKNTGEWEVCWVRTVGGDDLDEERIRVSVDETAAELALSQIHDTITDSGVDVLSSPPFSEEELARMIETIGEKIAQFREMRKGEYRIVVTCDHGRYLYRQFAAITSVEGRPILVDRFSNRRFVPGLKFDLRIVDKSGWPVYQAPVYCEASSGALMEQTFGYIPGDFFQAWRVRRK